MGVSSSQPIPSSQDHDSSTPTATPSPANRPPRYTPTMDDEAASQQLMSEARATTHLADYEGPAIPLNLDGASPNTTQTSKSGRKKAKKIEKTQNAPSEASPYDATRSHSHEDLKALTGDSPLKTQPIPASIPSTQIEVPDTQPETQINGAPSPKPLTTSQALSPKTSQKRSRKNKKNGQAEADPTDGNTIPATPYEEATEEAVPSSEATKSGEARKRRKGNKSQTSVNVAGPAPEEVPTTPAVAATLELAPGTSKANDKQDGDPGAEEEALTPRNLLGKLKAEKSQKSRKSQKSAGKATDAANDTADAALERSPAQTEPSDAPQTSTAITTPEPTESTRKRKRPRKSEEVARDQPLDWEAPARGLGNDPVEPLIFEDSDDNGAGPSSHKPRSRKDKKPAQGSPERSAGASSSTPRIAQPVTTSTGYYARVDDDDRTAADRALENTHELGHPPDKRTSGEYTADEKELIRRTIRDYQERNSLDTADLVEIIQWARNRKADMGSNTTEQTEEQFKKDCNAFWDEINNAGLLRKRKDLRKHIRLTYHTCQRGRWSQEEDEQLRELTNLHPGQWKLIATQLNRLELDAYNRWKDYVRHGQNRNTQRWTPNEEKTLVEALSLVCQRVEDVRAEQGLPPLDDYHSVINWHQVCREIGDTRSRLQCQSKWKIMLAREPPASLDVTIRPRDSLPPAEASTAIKSPQEKPQKKRRKSGGSKARQSVTTEADIRPPGPDDMLWGDKFDLIAELIQQATANESDSDDQIVWQDIAKELNQKWSVRTMQTAFKQLCELVLDPEVDDNLLVRLTALLAFIKQNHMEEAEDRFQPAEKIDVSNEDEIQAGPSKKRKRRSRATSGQASAKKRSKTTSKTAASLKSNNLVTESDDAESEPGS